MRRWFFSRPISYKATLLFSATSALALLASGGAIWSFQARADRLSMQREMTSLSTMLADSSAAALAFHDNRAAYEALASLRAEPRVSRACLYWADGVLAAQYRSPALAQARESRCPASPGADGSGFQGGELVVVQSARLSGERAGALWLNADLAEFHERLWQLGELWIAAMTGAILLTIAVSWLLQRVITGPILHLAAVAKEVSARRDYSIRAPVASDDEIGTLIGSFNQMMHQIEDRETALGEAHQALEGRVRERTRELETEIAQRRVAELHLVAAKEAAEASEPREERVPGQHEPRAAYTA